MRQGYFRGAPGILVSGSVWLAAALVAVFVSERASVLALLAGGAVIELGFAAFVFMRAPRHEAA
jgi:uncharacterized membrane protein